MAVDEELWNTERIRVFLGAKSLRSAMGTIARLGLEPVDREPGRAGMNRYRAVEVIERVTAMPGRGKRTDLGQNLGQTSTRTHHDPSPDGEAETGDDLPEQHGSSRSTDFGQKL